MKTSGRNDIVIWQSTAKAVQLISTPGTRIAVVFHVNPDGDAIGSALALCRFLEKLGQSCHVISPNGIPEVLNWMPGAERIIRASENLTGATRLLKEAGLIFALDFNEVGRVKELSPSFIDSSAYKVVIDHHPGPEDFTDCILSDTSASSTAELVYRFINQTEYSDLVDEDIATCLFAGIMTDTGCFSYNSSGLSTWETVASLLNYGINKDEIYHRIY
jgi:phosphoesterase RecJ-like protein